MPFPELTHGRGNQEESKAQASGHLPCWCELVPFSALLQLDKLANSILPEQIARVLSFATKNTETNS